MAETLLRFQTPIVAPDGSLYRARVCAAPVEGRIWHGWIEFDPLEDGDAVRSPRETTQPSRKDAGYWAAGLTPVYLEGALTRALHPTPGGTPAVVRRRPPDAPTRPVREVREPVAQAVLDPFLAYEKGEGLLRKRLGALSAWHLVNIILDYGLAADSRTTLERLPPATLVDRIVAGVRAAGSPVQARRR